MSCVRRKKVTVSTEQNLHTPDKGQTKQKKVAGQYDVCLCYCWRCEAESENENEKCEHGKVNEASFFETTKREEGTSITRFLLKEIAPNFHRVFKEGKSNFTASTGWKQH
jgi:hypothetical protein